MQRQVRINSKDTSELEHYVSHEYAPVKISPLGKNHKYGINGSLIHFDGLLLEWSRKTGNFRITPLTEFDAVVFCFADAGRIDYSLRKEDIGLAEGSVIAYRYPDHLDIGHASAHTSVVISNDLLQNRLSALLDRPVCKSVEFLHGAIERTQIGSLSSFISSLQTSPLLSIAKRFQSRSESIQHLIIDSFLLCYPNNNSEILAKTVPSVAPRHVKRALDYIHSNPKEHHAPSFLASLSGVSVRSLQYSFRTVTGHTITEYQLNLRLRHAHVAVVSRRDLPLKTIAEIWGFPSQGIFGQRFKQAYGLTPSDLRRAER